MVASGSVSHMKITVQMLVDDTYKRLFGTFFCEKPVMLKFKIKRVRREINPINISVF